MPDKRTAELSTIDVAVALINGLLVVDTVDLAAADDEQQKILVSTLLENFALSEADFRIGDLSIVKQTTSNNSTTEVLLADGLGNVRVRDISDLLAGTNAIVTEIIGVSDPISESYINAAESQQEVNQQNAGKLNDLQDQIDNVLDVGAAATIMCDPVPEPMETVIKVYPWVTVFDTTDPNTITLNPASNQFTILKEGVYELDWWFSITNDEVALDREAYPSIREVGGAIIETTTLFVSEAGFSGTWVVRLLVGSVPTTYELIHACDKDNELNIVQSFANIKAISTSGVPDSDNPYIINVFGTNVAPDDEANIQQAIADAQDGYIIRLFGTFRIEGQIDFLDKTDFNTFITFDGSAAFLDMYRSDATSRAFFCRDSNIIFKNINGHINAVSPITAFRLVDIFEDAFTMLVSLYNINFSSGSGTVTDLFIAFDSGFNKFIVDHVRSNKASISAVQQSTITNVYNSSNEGTISVFQGCVVTGNRVNTISASGSGNVITSNIVSTYSLSSDEDLQYLGRTGDQILNGNLAVGNVPPNERLHVYEGNVRIQSADSGSSAGQALIFQSSPSSPFISRIDGRRDGSTYGTQLAFKISQDIAAQTQLEAMTIFNNGNVAINETSPEGKLSVTSIVPLTQTITINSIAYQPSSWSSIQQANYINFINNSQSDTVVEPVRFCIAGRKVNDPATPTEAADWVTLSPYKTYGSQGDANGDPLPDNDYDPSLGLSVNRWGQVSMGWNGIPEANLLDPNGGDSDAAVFSVASFSNTQNLPENTIAFVASFRDRQKSLNIQYRTPTQTKTMVLNDTTGAFEFSSTLETTSTVAGLGNVILNGSSNDGKSIQFKKFGTDSLIRFLHHQGGDGLRMIWVSDDGLQERHIAYFDGDTERVGFGQGASSGAPEETVNIYGRLKMENETEPTTPPSGLTLYSEGGALKYKNQAGNIIVIDGSTPDTAYASVNGSSGTINYQAGNFTLSVSKVNTGTYSITHNLGDNFISVLALPIFTISPPFVTLSATILGGNTCQIAALNVSNASLVDVDFLVQISLL